MKKVLLWILKVIRSFIAFLIEIPAVLAVLFGLFLFAVSFAIKDNANLQIFINTIKNLFNQYLNK